MPGAILPGEIRSALDRILASEVFASAAGLSKLIRFLVTQTLAGQPHRLKEYTLGVEVFDRGESFDPRADTIVRVQARRLRSKLKQYYRGEGRSEPLVIEIPRGGYIPLFRERTGQIESLAVLPIKNVSGDPTDEYFTDGLTEALIADLSATKGPRVTSRASAMRFKGSLATRREIGEKLDVDALVEGSAFRENGTVRITAKLIEASTDRQLWAENYERELKDIAAVQADLTRSIACEVKAAANESMSLRMRQAHTPEPEAHELYLRGRHAATARTSELLKAVSLFQQAIKIDPEYAIAHTGLADAYISLASFLLPPREAMTKARAHATKALELDNSLAEANAALGMTRLFFDWDRAGAQKSVRQAIDLNPNCSRAHLLYALSLASQAKFNEALAQLHRAQELDPFSIELRVYASWVHLLARNYDQAAEESRRTLQLEPGFALGRSLLGLALALSGEHNAAIDELRAAADMEESPWTVLFLQHGYAFAGDKPEARKLLKTLHEMADRHYLCAYESGEAYTIMGETDEAFRWLDKAVEQRSDCMVWLQVEPWMDALRSDGRYGGLIERTGL